MAIEISAIDRSAFITPVYSTDVDNGVSARAAAIGFTNALQVQRGRHVANSNHARAQEEATGNLLSLNSESLDALNGVNTQRVSITEGLSFSNVVNANLTNTQQQQLATILEQFSNSPLNANNFIAFQNALATAGINPNQVSLQGILQELSAGFTKIAINNAILENSDTADLIAA